jgi:NAD(P)-dependent dehydrogenase (short-subunit alcohol dehydrogenase family)
MDLGIRGKRAIVTGGGRGLGKSIALNLAKEGAKVCLISRTEEDLVVALDALGGEREGHLALSHDLTIDGSPEEATKELQGRFGNPDIVINNLGGTLDIKDPFCSLEEWRKVWRFNLEVAIELNNLLIPYMKEQGWGRIVNISSISSLENQGPVTYCSAKAALTAYSRSMGRVLAPDGIVMTSLLPGAVFTKGGYWDYTSKNNPVHVKKYLDERMAIKRFGTLDEIGSVATFLCSEQVSFCVGSSFLVDGGQGKCFQEHGVL